MYIESIYYWADLCGKLNTFSVIMAIGSVVAFCASFCGIPMFRDNQEDLEAFRKGQLYSFILFIIFSIAALLIPDEEVFMMTFGG